MESLRNKAKPEFMIVEIEKSLKELSNNFKKCTEDQTLTYLMK